MLDENLKTMTSENAHIAICYNNIACIHARKKNFALASLFFDESNDIEEQIMSINRAELKSSSIEETATLAFRYFNNGYCRHQHYL